MPKIISESLKILSQAGLGMAMFSLGIDVFITFPIAYFPSLIYILLMTGLFMALQPKIIACGTSLAMFAMIVRFLIGPTIMATTSAIVGLRGVHLRVAIVQACLINHINKAPLFAFVVTCCLSFTPPNF